MPFYKEIPNFGLVKINRFSGLVPNSLNVILMACEFLNLAFHRTKKIFHLFNKLVLDFSDESIVVFLVSDNGAVSTDDPLTSTAIQPQLFSLMLSTAVFLLQPGRILFHFIQCHHLVGPGGNHFLMRLHTVPAQVAETVQAVHSSRCGSTFVQAILTEDGRSGLRIVYIQHFHDIPQRIVCVVPIHATLRQVSFLVTCRALHHHPAAHFALLLSRLERTLLQTRATERVKTRQNFGHIVAVIADGTRHMSTQLQGQMCLALSPCGRSGHFAIR